jgi:hypothetical protein
VSVVWNEETVVFVRDRLNGKKMKRHIGTVKICFLKKERIGQSRNT